MKLTVISNAPVVVKNNMDYMYGPYFKEMKIWAKHCNDIEFCCPIWTHDTKLLVDEIKDINYEKNPLHEFNITSLKNTIQAFKIIFLNLIIIYRSMKTADHIHLRCPGNVGLLGCIVQILFPKKTKTAKYAGNWDPKAKQPWSYKLQKWILNNTFLTKNMQVLVYGEWEGSSKNIKPFFTATYTNVDADKAKMQPQKTLPKNLNPIRFMFVGTLVEGKRPEYALELFTEVKKKYPHATLDFYGEGKLRANLEKNITNNNLETCVTLHGNQPKEVVEEAYKNNHFLILASKSEGWPKVVAEAMFWGCVPLSTNVSCVKQMMGDGKRGVTLKMDKQTDIQELTNIIAVPNKYSTMSSNGKEWSNTFTLDKFESEIQKLLVAKA